MFDKLKQMGDMRKQAKAMQQAMAEETVTGEAVQGMVKISMDGNQDVREVHIDPQLLTPENQEKLEIAIKEAIDNCFKELKSLMIRKVQSGEIAI
jgi:DNA-binding YbaB/EbfC family protein